MYTQKDDPNFLHTVIDFEIAITTQEWDFEVIHGSVNISTQSSLAV